MYKLQQRADHILINFVRLLWNMNKIHLPCCSIKEKDKEISKKKNKKCLTWKSSISFTLFVHNSQSFSKYFPIHFKDFLKLQLLTSPPNLQGFFLLLLGFGVGLFGVLMGVVCLFCVLFGFCGFFCFFF